MPRNQTTGDFVRVSNSFSEPVYGTVIDPTDADSLFNDYDVGLTFDDTSPLILIGSTSGVTKIQAADIASGTITFPAGTTDFSATGGTGRFIKQASAGAAFTVETVNAGEITGGEALTRVDDTNVTLTLGGTPATALFKAASITAGWTGTLAAGRLNANVVQAITNDTNVTGSIAAQNLTLGWTGQLSPTRGGTGSNLSATGGTGQVLKQTTVGGNVTVGTIPASEIASPAALTRTDDTNVTLTLGGAPSTALLAATSLTMGWSGQLSLARGGTNANLTASNGGIFYSTASAGAILAGTASASRPLLSGSSTTPSWAAVSYPSSGTSGGIAYFSSSTQITSSSLLTANQLLVGGGVGSAPSPIGSLGTTTTVLHGNAGGAPTFGSVSLTADITGTLAVANGGSGLASATAYSVICGGTTSTGAFQSLASVGLSGEVLTSNGAGALPTWQAVAGTGTVTSVSAGTGMSFSTITASGAVAIDKASSANYYAATSNKVVTTDIIYPSEVTVTYGATTTFDFDTFINAAVTLTGNITTQTFSNIRAGKSGAIRFIQDGSGSKTTVWNSNLKWAGGAAPTLSTAAGAVDVLVYQTISSSYIVASLIKGVA